MGTIVLADITELTTVKISELPKAVTADAANVLPIVKGATTQQIEKDDFLSAQAYSHIVFINNSFVNNESARQFNTIQAGIDFVYVTWGHVLDFNNKAVVQVDPGIYAEQIHSYANILIKSRAGGFDAIDTEPPATIYNTGADADHYPLRSDEDEVYELAGMNIETAGSKVFGKIPAGNYYSCRFNYGHFIERDSSVLAIFSNCTFNGSAYNGFYLTGTDLPGYRNILIREHCTFRGDGVVTLESTHTDFVNFKWTNTELGGSAAIGGDWDWRVDNSCIHRAAVRNVFSTTGLINIVSSTITNGLHFTSAPSSFKMINSSFEGISENRIPDGEADITSDVVITDAIYSNNTQHNGLSGNIQIHSPVKAVGCAALNRYFSVQDAINSIAITGVVDLRESLTGLAELTIPDGVSVTIDGHKLYSLTFIGDIVEVGANRSIVFFGLSQLNGGNIEVNGGNLNAYVGFEECLTVNAYVTLTSGTSSYCLVYTSTIKAPTGHPAIVVNTTDIGVVAGYSRMQGGVGHPAIHFTVEANNKLKGKFSTFLHGDGGANSPIVRTGAFSVIVAIYASAGNDSLTSPAAGLTNSISGSNNTDDPELDF